MSNPAQFLPPGFRFHPTDEELILHYMRSRAAAAPCPAAIIADVDIYKSDPWDLPAKAMFGDREWYFFSPRDRKYPNGVRPNRAAGSGYWKATGTDKPIHSTAAAGKHEHIGVKKALVFYKGKPPKGLKTNWIMHEYRLAEAQSSSGSNSYKPLKLRDTSMRLDDWVLCRIYKKSNHQPPTDREPDDSCVEEGSPWIPQNVTIHQDVDDGGLKLPKSASLSEFLDSYSALSHLFDELPEFPELSSLMGNNPIASQPINNGSSSSNNSINYLLAQQLPQSGSYTDNSLKRPRDDSLGLLNPSKRWSNSQSLASFTNQLDNTQFSLMNPQPLFNQPLLYNSQEKIDSIH